MSSDEISILLAREFEKHVSISKGLHMFSHNTFSFSQINSPKFDVEKEVESKKSLLDFGGVYNRTSKIFAHEDLLNANYVNEGKFNAISDSFHASYATISFDISCDEEENSEGCQSDYRFSSCADKSCKDNFKVYSDI